MVVGAGLAGTLISLALSRAGLAHALVGPEPRFDAPRLGESIDVPSSVQLLRSFPELAESFHRKHAFIGLCAGPQAFLADFRGFMGSMESRALLWMMGMGARPYEMMHLDRNRFDAAVFEQARSHPLAQWVPQKVVAVSFDRASDRVTELELEDGGLMQPQRVFDATAQLRLVARATGQEPQPLGPLRRAVFTHFALPDGAPEPSTRSPWQAATNLIRLHPDLNGLDGMAWCMPLGRHVSVGASFVGQGSDQPAEALLHAIEGAFASKQLRYRELYSEPRQVQAFPHRYFTHERAAGANWLLAGGAFAQVDFMSASGVTAALSAARAAAPWAQGDDSAGQRYQTFMKGLASTQPVFDQMYTATLTQDLDMELIDHWLVESFRRVAKYAQVGPGWLEQRMGAFCELVLSRGWVGPRELRTDRFFSLHAPVDRLGELTAAAVVS